MEAAKVDMFIMSNSKFFESHHLIHIRERLIELDDSRWINVQMLQFKDPTVSLIVSLLAGSLGVDRFPVVDLPTVRVQTTLPGASVEEIETQVSDILEEAVNRVEGITELRSVSSPGQSMVLLTFNLDRDIDTAAQDVRDRVSAALRDLPTDADPPLVMKADSDQSPVLSVAVRGNRSPRELTEIADKSIKQNLETLDYEAWLRRLFASDTAPETESLWRQTRVDRLVRRWGAQVGEENVTVIVLDPADRSMLLDTFERLLGLPAGFLVPADDQDNLSLPYPEVEMLRLFNRRFREEGLDPDLHVRAIRRRCRCRRV